MRGRSIPISPARRLVIDFMRLSHDIPLVSVQRRMRLERLMRARSQCAERPLWLAIFTKAYGQVCREFPQLRRAYVKLPWPQFYEYPQATALLPLAVDYRGEESLFAVRIRDPGALPLADVERRILDAKGRPVEQVTEFRRQAAVARLPLLIRRPLQWFGLNLGRQRANHYGRFS